MIEIGNLVRVTLGAPIKVNSWPYSGESNSLLPAGTISLVIAKSDRPYDEFICLTGEKTYYIDKHFLEKLV